MSALLVAWIEYGESLWTHVVVSVSVFVYLLPCPHTILGAHLFKLFSSGRVYKLRQWPAVPASVQLPVPIKKSLKKICLSLIRPAESPQRRQKT